MKYKLYIFLLLLMLNRNTLSNVISNETSTKKVTETSTKEVTETSTDSSKGNILSVAPSSHLSSDTKYEIESLLTKDNSSLLNTNISSSGSSNISYNSNSSISFNTNVNNDFDKKKDLQNVDKNGTYLPTKSLVFSTSTYTSIPTTTTTTTTTNSIFNTSDSDVIKITDESPNISDEIILNSTVSNNVEIYQENSTETTSLAYLDLIDNVDYLLENNETENNITIVRKCCDIDQFFSLVTGICESIENNIPFYKSVFNLLKNSDRNITYQTGTLKICPETNEPPSIISDITNSSYSILNSGILVDKISQNSFNQTHYCLELVGAKVEEAALTLAYCLTFDYDFTFYDYASDHEEEPQEVIDSYVHIVRKCCGEYEFYSTTVHKCIAADTAPLFPYEVQRLSFESNDIELKIISSRIHECPDKSVKPKIIPVHANEFRLIHTGDIIEVQNGLHHNYSYYCLELVGENENKLTFTLALCSQTIEVPKCCPSGKYFDEMHLDCLPHPENNDNYTDIMSIFKTDLETYSTVPIGHFLRCQNTFPVQDLAENLFLKGGKLCNNIACFEKEDYCIDYIGKDSKDLKASAFYCQKEYFVKCCKKGHILSIKGCTEYNDGKSVLLEHLTNTRNFVNSFDTKVCRKNKGILLDQTLASYVIWWVSNDGSYLTVSADPNKKILHNYCIDDFIDNDGHVGPGAYVCESDVNHLLPHEHHFLRYSKKGSLGKCCPENVKEGYVFYYSSESHNCEIVSYNESLKDNIFLKKASFIEEHFHDFPECPSKRTGYHSFPFQPGELDYADISSEGVLKIISKDGKCTLREDIVEDRDYCVEYVPTINGELKPAVFLCAYAPVTTIFEEKYIFITVCISISCFCLLCTLIYLFTVQVKRGFVTVRKVNTLAGRILVSFVSSNLIGFAAFSLTQHDNSLNKEDTIGCYILAGFVQFFNLATFCWNTSICLESLLLTIDISISKCIRYLLHSLWAWGFPFATTLIMFVMDAYREELPCGIITPKIGVAYCFHSDSDSKLVYFYVPILFTLIANLAFIFGAKAMRRSRLRKLEKGQRVPQSGNGNRSDKATSEGTQGGNSGMRTHQNLNTKTESVRLVLWTGTTWFSELAGFVLTRYIIKQPNDHWYNYLWYIPTSFNALRGAGIFGIIVLFPEKRKIKSFFIRTKIRLRKLYKAFKDSAGIEDSDSHFRSSTQKSSFADVRRRNMSVTTMISTLSSSIYNPTQFFTKSDGNSLRKASIGSYLSSKWESLRKTSSNNINSVNNSNERSARKKVSQSSSGQNGQGKPIRKLGMIRSVSQIDRRASNSSGNSFIEELEMEEDYGKRKCSIPLPKLQEEESYMEREESNIKPAEKTNKPSIFSSTNNLIKKSHSDTYIYGLHNKKEYLKAGDKELDKTCIDSEKNNTLTINNHNFNKSLSENNLPRTAADQSGEHLSNTSIKSNNSNGNKAVSFQDESDSLHTNNTTSNNKSDLGIANSGTCSEERNIEVTENKINSQVDNSNKNCYKSQKNVISVEETNENINLEKEKLNHSALVKRNIEHENSETKKISIELEECDNPVSSSDGSYEVYKESTA